MSTFYEVVKINHCRNDCLYYYGARMERNIIRTHSPKLALDVYIYHCYGLSPTKLMLKAQKKVVQNCYQTFQKNGYLSVRVEKQYDYYCCSIRSKQLILRAIEFSQAYDFETKLAQILIQEDEQQKEENENQESQFQKMEIQQLSSKVDNIFINQQQAFAQRYM